MVEDAISNNTERSTSKQTLRSLLAIAVILLVGTGLLHAYSVMTDNAKVVPARVAAELDARIPHEALEERKETLPVAGLPYPRTADSPYHPFFDAQHLDRIITEFDDQPSGLAIRSDTHLCLPGLDPCISGGEIAVSDGKHEWAIRFQMLGADNPSVFRSQIPKSRQMLHHLRNLVRNESNKPATQAEFYAAIKSARAKDADAEQAVVRLLRMLLVSYFNSEEFADTADFAEQNGLIQ